MEFLKGLLGLGTNQTSIAPQQRQVQPHPAQQAQSAPAPAPPHAENENRFVAKALSQPTAQAQPDQAPVGQSIEQQIKNLFIKLFQTAPQNALNLLMELMGPFMEMMNGQPSAQPAAQASPTPQAGLAPQPGQASTNPDLMSLIEQLGLGAGQAGPAPAQTMPTGQARPAEQDLEALLRSICESATNTAETQNPPFKLAPQATAQPSKTAQTTLAA